MTHCRVNNNWTNEDPKAVGKHFAKGGKEQQKLVHSKYSIYVSLPDCYEFSGKTRKVVRSTPARP